MKDNPQYHDDIYTNNWWTSVCNWALTDMSCSKNSQGICVHLGHRMWPCHVIWCITLCRQIRRVTVEEVGCDFHLQVWKMLPGYFGGFWIKNLNHRLESWSPTRSVCPISYCNQEVSTLRSFCLKRSHREEWNQLHEEATSLGMRQKKSYQMTSALHFSVKCSVKLAIKWYRGKRGKG